MSPSAVWSQLSVDGTDLSDLEAPLLGTLLPSVSDVNGRDFGRTYDWALVDYSEKTRLEPNTKESSQVLLEVARFDPFHGPVQVAVMFRGSPYPGSLSAVPTSTILPGSDTFVNVYTFVFEESPGT